MGEQSRQDESRETTPDEERFVRDLVTRGEAVKAEDGELPPGATHEIVKENPDGLPEVKRRRFTAY